MNRGQDAFAAGQAGMVLDGSFRISKFAKTEGLNFAIAELPGHDGNRFNFSSYWVNGISSKADGEKKLLQKSFYNTLHLMKPCSYG
jgi:multiple sugar transport system substrate-binding protein